MIPMLAGKLDFNFEKVDFEDTIRHIYIVDTEFDIKNATERELAYIEIYPPIIEKQKTIDPCERSVFQLLEQYIEGEKGPKSYKSTAKAHATLSHNPGKNFYQCI